jgi:Fe-S-cluster containining protein
MSELCQQCRSRCCRYFCFEIDTPTTFEEFDNIRWYVLHEGITVHIDQGCWFMAAENRCKNLDDDNHCRDYANRPVICRSYADDGCDFTEGDYGYEVLFAKPEAIEAYARKTLGPAAYDREKAKVLGLPVKGKPPAKPRGNGRSSGPATATPAATRRETMGAD